MLLSSIPIVAEGDIPKTGTVRKPVTTQISGSWRWTSESPAAAHETEAILLESLNHRSERMKMYLFECEMAMIRLAEISEQPGTRRGAKV
eukprot:11572510-Ditylum_brightwellii.AAC.1